MARSGKGNPNRLHHLVILFIMGMNLLITAAKKEFTGPIMQSGVCQPQKRGFMDDLTITTLSHIQARWVLKVLNDVAKWARMKFKPRKSKSMVSKDGKVKKQSIRVQEEDGWVAEEDRRFRSTREFQGLALPAWSPTKTCMATDDLQGSDDISGRNGEESEQTLPQVSWRSTKLHVSRPVHTV